MIGDSKLAYVWVVFWAGVLHSIAPLCVAYTFFSRWLPSSLQLPTIIQFWVWLETGFYFLTYVHRKYHIQQPAIHPETLSKAERQKLFQLCSESTPDFAAFLQAWFLGAPWDTIKRENAKEFMRWAFFNTAVIDPFHEDEIEEYAVKYETRLGRSLPPGRGSARCIRLTIDAVDTLHRSVVWYGCIFIVDLLTHAYMRIIGFRFYRASAARCLNIVPPRPHAFIANKHSASKDINYWYYPHTSTTELPLVFLHGIGVGLYPYMEFLKEMNQGRTEAEGTIGIIAIEILSVSSRIKRAVMRKDQMCEQFRLILDHHGFDKFVLASHSYGSVISTYFLKTPDLAERITSVILVDPISILLHQPDVAYNFTIRKPTKASEWLIWYFGSKDIGVAHTLSRTFFWSENILWKQDLAEHRAVIFLAEKDSIINAPAVREYLRDDHLISNEKSEEENLIRLGSNETEKNALLGDGNNGRIEVVWCKGLNHGMVFDRALWRGVMKGKILRELKRGRGSEKC